MSEELRLRDIIKPGEPVDKEALEKLEKLWIKTYLALSLLTSKGENKPLQHMKDKLIEAHQAIMSFFDSVRGGVHE